MGRTDLIGGSKKHLVPAWQPVGTGRAPAASRRPETGKGTARTQHTLDRPRTARRTK
jgi:hypothetical protein